MAKTCSKCNAVAGFLAGLAFVNVHGEDLCSQCAQNYINEGTKNIIVTTTHSVDGYSISSYHKIESVEIVIGTGMFSEFTSSVNDFFWKQID